MVELPGNYLAGFIDGEGCFYIHFRKDIRHGRKNRPIYYYWDIGFAIVLREDDLNLLKMIKNTLGFGYITVDKRGQARLQITKITELRNKLVPFLKKYPLYGKKKYDFLLWRKALEILYRQSIKKKSRRGVRLGKTTINWNKDDLIKLAEIQKSMRRYKSRTTGIGKWLEK